MAVIQSRRCACGHQYDVITHQGVTLTIDAEEEHERCPECDGEEYINIIHAGTGVELGGDASTGKFYPRWDHGLGCHVESAKHRRKLMKERGLVPLEGDIDVDEYFRGPAFREEDRLLEVHKDYKQRLKDDPAFADARRLRDRGHPDYQWSDD